VPARSVLASGSSCPGGTEPWQPVGLPVLEGTGVGSGCLAQGALGLVTLGEILSEATFALNAVFCFFFPLKDTKTQQK